jgi:hypothetical protein
MSVDSLGPPRGFSFTAGELPMGGEAAFAGQTLVASVPRPAQLRLMRNGESVVAVDGYELEHVAAEPGVYRVEAHLNNRTWILSNPVYLR